MSAGSPVQAFQRVLARPGASIAPPRRRRLRARLTLIVFVGLFMSGAHAAESIAGWSTITLPYDRAAFAALLDLDEDVPRGVLLVEALRRLHDADIHGSTLRATVSATLAGETGRPAATTAVPLPLTVPVWCALLGSTCDDTNVAARILGDPAAGMIYLGLSSADEGTRSYLAAHPALLAWLKANRPGTFAAFARSLHIAGDRIATPGGAMAAPLWQALVGEPPTSPDAFVRSLLTLEGGRYAYMFDTLDGLDEAHQRYAVTMEDGAGLIALGRVFAATEPAWDVESRPFVRPFFDAAALLANLAVTADGRLAGPRTVELWSRVFDADGGEIDEDDQAELLEGPDVEAVWLARALDSANLAVRQSRTQAILFGARLGVTVTRDNAADAVTVLRGAIRLPALVLALDRMGVRDLALTATLLRISRRLTSQGDDAARDRSLIIWQGALALVDRLVFMGRLAPDDAAGILTALARAASEEEPRIGVVVAAWIRDALLPRLATGGSVPSGDSEIALVAALGGAPSVDIETMTWEDGLYQVDPASAERARLEAILGRMGGCTLSQALEAAAVAAMLAGARNDGDTQAAAQRLSDLVASFDATTDVAGELHALGRAATIALNRASRTLSDKQSRSVGRRVAGSIEDAATTMLSIALRRLTYAAALGDPESQATLAGDVAARHTLGAARAGPSAGPLPQWTVPDEEAVSMRGWHVQGSLLALDVALGRLWLRRTLGDMPLRGPTLNESERRVLIAGLVLLPPASLSDGDRTSILAAMDRGRTRIGEAAADAHARAALCHDAGVCGWRNELLAWIAREEPDALFSAISRADLVRLGSAGEMPPDVWGTVTLAIDGALAPRFTPPLPLEAMSGRAPLAQALGRFADLKLRVAELTADLGVPSRLVRDVMASALQDYLDDVRPAYPEDWPALLAGIERITRGRVEDYVAGLTAAGGPLVPKAPPDEDVR